MKKYFLFPIILIGMFILAGCTGNSYLSSEDSSGLDSVEIESEDENGAKDTSKSCYVQVTGAVKNPGVFEVNEDSRLFEVIEMAGGLTEDAAEECVNRAVKVTDGQSIHIPTFSEISQEQITKDSDGRVNINTADASELMTLRGIGQAKADLIISYREENGPYSSVEEIMNIQGIKEGVYNKIKDDITVGY